MSDMRKMLLTTPVLIAAALGVSAPAHAQSFSGPAFAPAGTSEWSGTRGEFRGFDDGDRVRHDRRDRRHRRDHSRRDTVVIGDVGWNEGWALYNNRTWESDSYNDWWHDRPERSYPRWMMNNQGCQRQWWSGGGWRC